MYQFAANLSFFFQDLPFEARFSAARAAGFSAVEYLFPYVLPKDQVAELLRKNGLTQALFNAAPGNWEKGERGLATHKDRKEEFRASISQALDYAKSLQCKQVHVMSGIAPSDNEADYDDLWRENLLYAAVEGAKQHVRILIEPINRHDMPHYALNNFETAMRLIEEVGHENLYLQYDIYHAQRICGDLTMYMEKYWQRIAHIQIADVPGRHEPGTGEINYAYLFAKLTQLQYKGFIGCEYKPRDGLDWLKNLPQRGNFGAHLQKNT